MKTVSDYLNCGNIYINREAVELVITKLQDLNTIISLFNTHVIVGIKYLEFVKAVEMFNKSHLTKSQLRTLKDNMNKGRYI